jgi:hypothetical protein
MERRQRIPASHVTMSQAARFVGVSQPRAWKRFRASGAAVEVLGVWMVPVEECRRWLRERLRAGRTTNKENADE